MTFLAMLVVLSFLSCAVLLAVVLVAKAIDAVATPGWQELLIKLFFIAAAVAFMHLTLGVVMFFLAVPAGLAVTFMLLSTWVDFEALASAIIAVLHTALFLAVEFYGVATIAAFIHSVLG